jgi:4-aminobutyrate--pyruvate transaminase
LPANHRSFDLPIDRILHTDCPHHYRFAEERESEEAFATRLAESLERLIEKEGPETIAAFFAEPVMGAGGVIVPPKTYFEKIQPILKKHDILFVADEVICGFGRTGNMFATETFNLQPDIITVAKALSSAYLPISALLINEKVSEPIYRQSGEIGTFGHGFTYSAHPVSAAVAVETLKIYEERDTVGHVRSVMRRFQDGLRAFADHPMVGEVRGIGLVAGVELSKDKATKTSFDPKAGVGMYLAGRALEHGLIIRAIPGDTITLCPPLIITAKEIDDLLGRFGKALDDTAAWVAKKG